VKKTVADGNSSRYSSGMASTSPNSVEPINICRLRSVTNRLHDILLEYTKKQFWVRAQLVSDKGTRKAGHFFGELVDVGDRGETVAKMRAVIWRDEYEKIQQKLIEDGQTDSLHGNREICALCSLRFHEVYGLQLQIFDVDPNFGESHINRNRRKILEKLQKDGLLVKNKATVLATAPLRIGLITSGNSAAYADFTTTLGASRFSFKVSLVSTTMQGPGTAGEVVTAIRTLIRSQVDVICLVRGGGSPVDLAWFDHEAIGRTIGNSPVPVWVGIGHEIDVTVPDLVAHTRFNTPTAVAEALVERIRTLDNDLHLSRDRLAFEAGHLNRLLRGCRIRRGRTTCSNHYKHYH
jgi:exodeoxyribonuclease VII large subunit